MKVCGRWLKPDLAPIWVNETSGFAAKGLVRLERSKALCRAVHIVCLFEQT